MQALFIYNNNHYIKEIDTELNYFDYIMETRYILRNKDILHGFLENAIIDNSKNPSDFQYAYKFENNSWHFYEYAFDIWEDSHDYKDLSDLLTGQEAIDSIRQDLK